jgi:hypothetical protein
VASALPFVLCFGLVATLGLVATRQAGKLILVDPSPVGDPLLDEIVHEFVRIGAPVSVQTYLRRQFSASRLASYLTALRESLVQEGYLGNASQRTTFLGMVDVRQVERAHPGFRAIGDRVRSVILVGSAIHPDAVALALLFSRERAGLGLTPRGGQAVRGIDQFFGPDERPMLRHRLKQIRTGDPAITAALGNDLYDTLVAILLALETMRRSSGAG